MSRAGGSRRRNKRRQISATNETGATQGPRRCNSGPFDRRLAARVHRRRHLVDVLDQLVDVVVVALQEGLEILVLVNRQPELVVAANVQRNVADEVARIGVQVNALGTNFMDFPEFLRASGASDPEVRAKVEQQVPMRRLGTVDEVAEAALWLASGQSSFMTGHALVLDGGASC